MTLEEVSYILKGRLVGENIKFHKISIPSLAKENDLSFIKNHESLALIKSSSCKNFIVSKRLFLPRGKNYIVVNEDPILCLEKLLQQMKVIEKNEILKKAIISPKAIIGKNVTIGKNSLIEDNVKIYDNVKIGEHVKIYSGAIIGKPGFSHYIHNNDVITLDGIGSVVIENSVEIGANSCVDAGIFGDTTIGENTKIDNFCQIGHDVKIGKNSIICSQVGIAGYTSLGENSIIYGKVGISDSLILGNNFIAKGYSAVTKSFPDNSIVSGIPARNNKENLKRISKKY
ncbi:hypothetical protein [Cetobacterium sp.]|uniref:hypothetical protein n=1 Tax=Cetobacterium sp. TaxID=2071632 RepID=UPI003F355478